MELHQGATQHAGDTNAQFLVDKHGKVVERYSPTTKPEAIEKQIEKLLQQ